jgi:predicted amidohydrolase
VGGIVIRGGRLVDPASGTDAVADVAVLDGRIAAIGTKLGDAERAWPTAASAAHSKAICCARSLESFGAIHARTTL